MAGAAVRIQRPLRITRTYLNIQICRTPVRTYLSSRSTHNHIVASLALSALAVSLLGTGQSSHQAESCHQHGDDFFTHDILFLSIFLMFSRAIKEKATQIMMIKERMDPFRDESSTSFPPCLISDAPSGSMNRMASVVLVW